MKLADIYNLFESPILTFPTNFDLDTDKGNASMAKSLMKEYNKTALKDFGGEYTLWEFKRAYALIRNVDNYIAYYMQFKFDNVPLIKRQCVRQIAVWRSEAVTVYVKGLAEFIFKTYLLHRYGTVITDAEQTPDGKRFWGNRMLEALHDPSLYVYYLNYHAPRELVQIHTEREFENIVRSKPAYGETQAFETRRFIITSKPFNVKKVDNHK